MHYSNLIIGDDERAVSLTMTVVCYVDRFPRSRKPVQFRRIPDSLPPPVVCDQPRASCDLCRRASRNSKGPAPQVCDLGPPDCSLCRLALRNTNLSKQLDALLSDNTDMHRHAQI